MGNREPCCLPALLSFGSRLWPSEAAQFTYQAVTQCLWPQTVSSPWPGAWLPCLDACSLVQVLCQERSDYGKGKPFSDHCNIFFLKVLNNSFYI